MKCITFKVNGKPKHVFLSHIGILEEAPGYEGVKTRVYVQGVPLIVPGVPDAVLADIQAAAQEDVLRVPDNILLLAPEEASAAIEKAVPKQAKRKRKDLDNVDI